MPTALEQVAELNNLFQSGIQPIKDYAAARVGIAQQQNQRAYQQAQVNDQRAYQAGQDAKRRADAKTDEAYMFGEQKKRAAVSARAQLGQLGKPASEIAALTDDGAIYLANDLAKQNSITTEANARIAAQRDADEKSAVGILLNSGVTPQKLLGMTAEQKIAQARIETQKADTTVRLATEREIAGAMLTPQEESQAQGLGIQTSGAAAKDVRKQLFTRQEQILKSTNSYQGDAIRDLQNRRTKLEALNASIAAAQHDDDAVKVKWVRANAPKILKDPKVNPNNPADVLAALAADKKLSSLAAQAVDASRETFEKQEGDRTRQMANNTRELTGIINNLDNYRKGYNPFYDENAPGARRNEQPAQSPFFTGLPNIEDGEGDPVAPASGPMTSIPDPIKAALAARLATQKSAASKAAPTPLAETPVDPGFRYETPFRDAEDPYATGLSMATGRDLFYNILKPSAPVPRPTSPRDPSLGWMFMSPDSYLPVSR